MALRSRLAGRGRAATASAFLLLALLFGGGGIPTPMTELVVELGAVVALIAWLWIDRPDDTRAAVAMIAVAVLVVALPLLQLIPLPPGIWQGLPGRETTVAALSLIGEQNSWRPLSLTPSRTASSLLSLGPPILVLLMTAALPARDRWWPVATIAGVGLLSVVVGAGQLASDSSGLLRFYDKSHEGWLIGFQANRNATVDVLLIAMLACAAFARRVLGRTAPANPRSRRARGSDATMRTLGWAGLAIALLMLGVVLTGSRAGIALSLFVLPIVLAILHNGRAVSRRLLAIGAGLLAVVAALGWFALQSVPALRKVVARFDFAGEFRPELWTDTAFAIGQFWPWGGGMGSFIPLLNAAERLEVVDPTKPNRAHNDYLEFVLEAGLPGIVVLIAVAAIAGWCFWRAWRRETLPRIQLLFAGGTAFVIGAHSLADYPLRSLSLACLLACAVGMLAPPRGILQKSARRDGHETDGAERSGRRVRGTGRTR